MTLKVALPVVLAAAIAALAAATSAQTTSSTWRLAPSSRADGYVDLTLSYIRMAPREHHSEQWSEAVRRSDLAARLAGASAPIRFDIVREPGTFECTGIAGSGAGNGDFTFRPSARFADELAAGGLGRPDFDQSLRMSFSGATIAFIDALPKNPPPSLAQVVRALEHGVNADYLEGLASAGYRDLTLDTLTRMRDHGVSVETVTRLRAAGYTNLSPEDMIRLVDHGARPDYIAALQAAGYRNLSADQLVRLVDHGVRAEFIRSLAQRGYRSLSVDDLVRLVDHGVTIAFIDRLRSHGYRTVTPDELVRLRDSGL